jgi:cytochrome c
MKLIAVTLTAATALFATSAMASMDLAKKSNCMACHAVDKKVVGPAYAEVAKKYAGQKDAEAKLTEKVMKGGVGVWGNVPMPPKAGNPALKEEDARTLVKWILAGAK